MQRVAAAGAQREANDIFLPHLHTCERTLVIFGQSITFHGGDYATALLMRCDPSAGMLARGKSSARSRPREVWVDFPSSGNPTR